MKDLANKCIKTTFKTITNKNDNNNMNERNKIFTLNLPFKI